MDLRQSETWQRHQLAVTEHMQADIARYTHPVMRTVSLCGVAYLTAWAALMCGAPVMVALVAGLTAAIVLLGAPAFVLAAGIEWYFHRRLAGVPAMAAELR